jgi:hypothetical protein
MRPQTKVETPSNLKQRRLRRHSHHLAAVGADSSAERMFVFYYIRV